MVRLAHGSSPVGLKSTQPFLPELRSLMVACWKIPTMKMMVMILMMHMMIMVMMPVMMMMFVRLLQRVEEDALIALPLTKGFHHFHQMDKIDPTLRVKRDLPPLRCRSQTAAGSQPRLCHRHEGPHSHRYHHCFRRHHHNHNYHHRPIVIVMISIIGTGA